MIEGDTKRYDRFRDRVMFPIADAKGRVIAFGGRALAKDAQAKYLNSSETPIFHKGSTLYNLNRARKPAHDAVTLFVVEGYVDAIALDRAGLSDVVAPLGTQATAGAGYQAPLRGELDWYLRADAAYRGKQFQDAGNEAMVPASTTVNAHLGPTKENWTGELYALNLSGNDKPTGGYRDVFFSNTTPDGVNNSGTFFPWRYSASYPRLEQFAVTWRMKF